ncbi:hypothetical protein ACFSQ3_12935 [Sphingobacterium corticis]|uniref:DUF8188 domain-containing protein n=1 Tax=Sphingobacterium corticis TaxID=1812823 RepID=A0ABW5NPD5_9SPHI
MGKANTRGLFSVIGMLIGGLLIIPLGMRVIDLSRHRNNFQPLSETYSTGFIEMPVRMANLNQSNEANSYNNYLEVLHTIKYAATGRKDASERVAECYKIDQDLNSKKFFKLIMIVPWLDLKAHEYFRTIEEQDSLILLINREEYLNPTNGTKEHPYLVFGVRGAEKPLTWEDINENKVYNVDIKPEQYSYSAEMYWTYIATKEEFERRFSKSK